MQKTNKTVELNIISGIPAGESGTGRLVGHLKDQLSKKSYNRINLIEKPEKPAYWKLKKYLRERKIKEIVKYILIYLIKSLKFFFNVTILLVKRHSPIMLLHPQNLGYNLSLEFIRSRNTPLLIYLLDSSFFCISSYNYLKGDNKPCLRCIEFGFSQIQEHGCKPFPGLDWSAIKFVTTLKVLARELKVNFVAQTSRQAMLAQKHFDLMVPPPIIHLWSKDWDDLVPNKKMTFRFNKTHYSWDILFHGNCLEAKGVTWTTEIAKYCPDLRFMFPFSKPDWLSASKNCIFKACSWETGLPDEIEESRFVIVPSLWSAPIEGALIKSIILAEGVIVVRNSTSFCDELPDGVVLKVSSDPKLGGNEIIDAFKNNWHPDPQALDHWQSDFLKIKNSFFEDFINPTFQ
jgi:hypothetical protein